MKIGGVVQYRPPLHSDEWDEFYSWWEASFCSQTVWTLAMFADKADWVVIDVDEETWESGDVQIAIRGYEDEEGAQTWTRSEWLS